MTKPSYENQVFNVQLIEGWDDGFNTTEKLRYKLGCRDTRHQASKIAMEADAEIKKLKGLLDDARLFLADSGCKNFIEEIEKALYD